MLQIVRFLTEENGQGLTEYALILSLIVCSIVGIYFSIGPKISGLFSEPAAQLN